MKKSRMKKTKKFLKSTSVLLLSIMLFSCSNNQEEEIGMIEKQQEQNMPTVQNERLVFKDGKQYSKFIEDKNLLKELAFTLSTNKFAPLREVVSGNENEYADFILDLYNKNREIQIGSELIFIKDWTQYIVKNQNEELFAQVKRGEVTEESKELKIYKIERKIIPLKQDTTNQQRNWLDARYQKEFTHNGGRMKFVNEAYLNVYYIPIGNGYVTAAIDCGVRAKYEWLHGRTWKPAGENVYKEVRNLSIRLKNSVGEHVLNRSMVYQEDNRNLVVNTNTNSIAGNMNYTLEISGDFYSEVRHYQQPNYNYRVYCNWKANFVI